MKDLCILSDFDGTITKKDGLYSFIETYAKGNWQEIELQWENGEINSKQCLIEEFSLVPNLSPSLISDFISTVEIDEYFAEFYSDVVKRGLDFYIVSDGIDYFIDAILKKYGLDDVNIISNHGEFIDCKFEITFPNDYSGCLNSSGTCKCNVVSNLRKKYERIVYIGDGVSDFCVANKSDLLFAKSKLLNYCKKKSIPHIPYNSYYDIKIFDKI